MFAAPATAGALLAIGSRASTAARPFNMIAGHVVGLPRADAFGFEPSVTLVGLALHFLLVTLAAVAVAAVARRRFAPDWLAAIVVSLLGALVSIGIARRDGASLARLLAVGDLLVFYTILAATLVIGIRLAFFDGAEGRSHSETM
jgi:hypothetical protein